MEKENQYVEEDILLTANKKIIGGKVTVQHVIPSLDIEASERSNNLEKSRI